ncbi:MAG: FAD-dependent 5-carboxymethylaminomethyl-2-thiouridine(34) oxidoreductase MnmC, partial [Gammaproteobacteria bacterium]|nr:FAD-dependent 5-carboxymethylaminomethyl-2-thiouridine(34) oxidoreductase MnmC [Gammaproteobacteria bacterium]
PARNGEHCIGATFSLQDPDSQLRDDDHRENLARLAAAVPDYRGELSAINTHTLRGRVGYRCATPDYLPLVGAVPERQAFLRDYGQLRKNARQIIHSTGEYVPGLYLNTGHGSRGLTSTPIAAEMLASQMCGEPPPLDRELCRALAPARFLLRDLSRNRI